MLEKHEQVDPSLFLREFDKRFSNFCTKAPVELSYRVTPTGVHVHELKSNEVKRFDFDFSLPVKANISLIKEWLKDTKYPVMIQVENRESDYTILEVQQMIKKGIPEETALLKKKVESKSTRWRIERVIVKWDELFVRNLESNVVNHYKLKMPCILFLKKIREKLSPFEAWEMFMERAILFKSDVENQQQ